VQRFAVIGQDTIERVREYTGIVAVVGETVKLHKRGRTWVGLCPFHREKTPSFHVSEERGRYHCFGCSADGDVIRFIQEIEGLSFVEAVRQLAERAGIEIVEEHDTEERRKEQDQRRRQEELYAANEAAAAYFEAQLRQHPLAGLARDELRRRGLDPDAPAGTSVADALQAFRVGYAPAGWDGLATALRDRGLSARAAEDAGLLVPRKSGTGHYDRFRHRLMFAVVDLRGRVVAFSGRALAEPTAEQLASVGLPPPAAAAPDQAPAKYMNSPESPVYRKREVLFGLHQARQAIRATGRCVLVEGNFDVVSLHARDVRHVVAPLGTAFTEEQARQILRFSRNLVVLFDGDAAGRKATVSARPVCNAVGLDAKVGTLPQGIDPDELVRQGGPEAIERVLGAAKGMLEYLIEASLDADFSRDDARGQAARLQQVVDLIASEPDPTVRALAERHADTVAARLGISDARTLKALQRALRQSLGPGQRPEAGTPRAAPPVHAKSRNRRAEIDQEILGALLDYPELLDTPDVVQALQWLEGDAALAAATWRRHLQTVGSRHTEAFLAKVPSSIHAFAAARLAAPKHDQLEQAKAELRENVRKLERLASRREQSAIVEQLEKAGATGDFEQQVALLREHLSRTQSRRGQ